MSKKIELCTLKAGDVKAGFGNPRKISKAKLEELAKSLEMFGNFGILLIDEENNIIAGNQRLKAIKMLYGSECEVECKRLIGFTEAELRAINIKDNTHEGEWDLDLLADWTADLNVDIGIKESVKDDTKNREIEQMELLPFERYNYVVIACRTNIDYDLLVTKLGIKDKKVLLGGKRAVNARAVWYNDVEGILFGGDK